MPRASLYSWRFLSALKTAPKTQRLKAAGQTLSSAILAEIVDELEQQREPLNQAIADLEKAEKDLAKVKLVIDAIAGLIGIVARIVTLL